MSEYQRYEFMTIDRPLTGAQLEAVNDLSSHIEASATHALIEYNWGDFKHDPIDVLYRYFDGFLYWANWGSPRLAFRFPHGSLPPDLISGYEDEDFVKFTRHSDYDILDFHFGEMEAPDEWIQYELGPLIPIRDELMEGDLRGLYIVWLAMQIMIEGYDEVEEEDYDVSGPPVPAGFGELTEAHQALAALFRVPEELLVAAARHSNAATKTTGDDFVAWIKLLPAGRQAEYLLRLANNEPGLSRQFVRELRELGQERTGVTPPMDERVTYSTLLTESKGIKVQLEREKREKEQLAHLRHLQKIHNQQEDYWDKVDEAASRGTSAGYNEAHQLLVDLREVADHFNESEKFQQRFRVWVRPHLRRPALIKRLQSSKFTVPGV